MNNVCFRVADPEPDIMVGSVLFYQDFNLDPVSVNPDPLGLNPEPVSLNPDPVILNPDPVNLNFDLVNLNPDPVNLNSDPVNIGPDPFAQNALNRQITHVSKLSGVETIDIHVYAYFVFP